MLLYSDWLKKKFGLYHHPQHIPADRDVFWTTGRSGAGSSPDYLLGLTANLTRE